MPETVRPKVDPDPIVIEFLVGLATNAVGSMIAKLGKRILQHRRRSVQSREASSSEETKHLEGLQQSLDLLDGRIKQALDLIPPGQKRKLGQEIFVDPESMREYQDLREGLFSQVRDLDAVTQSLAPLGDSDESATEGPGMITPEFKSQVKLIERKLRTARTATSSDESLLELRSAVAAMRRAMQYIEDSKGSTDL